MPRPKPRSSDRLSLKQIPVRGMGSTSLNGSKTHSVPFDARCCTPPARCATRWPKPLGPTLSLTSDLADVLNGSKSHSVHLLTYTDAHRPVQEAIKLA